MKKRFVNDWILLGKMQKLQYDYILCIKKSFLFVHLLCLMLTFVLAYFHIRLIPKTLPIKFASRAFAFDAILVPFTARLSFWLCVCCVQSVFYRKLSKGCRTFFRFWEESRQKSKNG